MSDTLTEVIVATMRETAPLYAAYPTLFEWLAKHGVVIFQNNDLWCAQSEAPSNAGTPLGELFTSFSAVLEFALNQCAENICKGDIPPDTTG